MISCFKGKFEVTSPRAERILNGKKEYHAGIDIVSRETNKIVYAVASGIVRTLNEPNGFGLYVRQHLNDLTRMYYGHLKEFLVKDNTYVQVGEPIGIMGATGNVTGAHTHLEWRVAGTSKESLDICDFTGIPNKKGLYHENMDLSKELQKKCGFIDSTMKYLKEYKYSKELIRKLWEQMN